MWGQKLKALTVNSHERTWWVKYLALFVSGVDSYTSIAYVCTCTKSDPNGVDQLTNNVSYFEGGLQQFPY